jgi:hypothetical protein
MTTVVEEWIGLSGVAPASHLELQGRWALIPT